MKMHPVGAELGFQVHCNVYWFCHGWLRLR